MPCDDQQNPYIFKINSLVGFMPPSVSMTSYLPLVDRESTLTYNDLIKTIIDSAYQDIIYCNQIYIFCANTYG